MPMAHEFWRRVHNDPSRSSKVVDFGTNRKPYRTQLVLSCNIRPSAILPHFRDYYSFLYADPLFPYQSPISVKFSGCSIGVDPWCCSLRRAYTSSELKWNYFQRISTYVITIPQYVIWTDGRTDNSKIACFPTPRLFDAP